jgi:hypothetical protein
MITITTHAVMRIKLPTTQITSSQINFSNTLMHASASIEKHKPDREKKAVAYHPGTLSLFRSFIFKIFLDLQYSQVSQLQKQNSKSKKRSGKR